MDEIARTCGKCGKEKRPSALLCPRCQEQYRKDAMTALRGGEKLTIYSWAEDGVAERISSMDLQLTVKRAALDALQKEVAEEARETVREMLGGERLSQERFRDMLEETHKTLWAQEGGNRLFAEWKTLETDLAPKIEAAKALMAKIELEKGVGNLLNSLTKQPPTESPR